MDLLCSSRQDWRTRRRAKHLPWIAAWTALGAFHGFQSAYGQETKRPEYEVKAAYLYNFGNFVQWPAPSAETVEDAFTICVLGQDPFGPILDSTVGGETIYGKKVVIKRLLKPKDATICRILFIAASEEDQLREILLALEKTSVLTVSDLPDFVRRGGMVQFVLDQGRVRFEINLISAKRAGLTLSSQLLKLATKVRVGSQRGD